MNQPESDKGSQNLEKASAGKAILRFGCYIAGWAGWGIMTILGPGQQIALLRMLAGTIAFFMKAAVTQRIYHAFRGHEISSPEKEYSMSYGQEDPKPCDEDVVVMFSGGKDSTYVAWLISFRFRTVHLLTLKIGTNIGAEKSEKSVKWLMDSRGADKFVHHYINGEDLFFDFHFSKRKENRRLFGPTAEGAGCIPCHIVMETLAILYCRKNGIRHISFGLSPQSRISFDQNPKRITISERFLGKYGIKLILPLWEQPDTNPLEELYRHGVISNRRMGKPIQFGPDTATQGSCPLGIWNTINQTRHEFSKGFDSFIDVASKYRAHLENICEAYLAQNCGILHDKSPSVEESNLQQ